MKEYRCSDLFDEMGQKAIDDLKINRDDVYKWFKKNNGVMILLQTNIGSRDFVFFFGPKKCKFHFNYYDNIISSIIKQENISKRKVISVLKKVVKELTYQLKCNIDEMNKVS